MGMKARQGLRKFLESAEKTKKKRRVEVLKAVKNSLPCFLKKFPTVCGFSLIGSVAKKEFYSSSSDVDIVVKGLKKGDYFKAFRFWEEMIPCEVDLIREEEISDNVRPILARRLIIYEADRK